MARVKTLLNTSHTSLSVETNQIRILNLIFLLKTCLSKITDTSGMIDRFNENSLAKGIEL